MLPKQKSIWALIETFFIHKFWHIERKMLFSNIQVRNLNYSSFQKYVPIELLAVTISVSRRMILFRSGNCLSKLERVKANSIKMSKIIDNYNIPEV
jgi:hypothetical protein